MSEISPQSDNKRSPVLDIWYVCPMSLCNFDCAYCASGTPENGGARSRREEWKGEGSRENFDKVVLWLAHLPFRLNLKIITAGEPLVSWDLLKALATLARLPHINFVDTSTNGSLITKRLPRLLDEFSCPPRKLSLWITWHSTQIEAEALLAQAKFAHDNDVNVTVNTLLFTDNHDEVRMMAERCSALGLRFHAGFGFNSNEAFEGSPYVTARDSTRTRELIERIEGLGFHHQLSTLALIGLHNPKGLPCSAGQNYLFVAPNGDIFPCSTYARQTPDRIIGSALDKNFIPTMASELLPCFAEYGCVCQEDFTHLTPGPQEEREHPSLLSPWRHSSPQFPNSEVVRRLQMLHGTPLLTQLGVE
ncbi:MAG: radical SAM protein [Verrucomicrobiota bacterium]|nr:radical SAM protein [Verrucomicrobiota bacterium]